MKELFTKTNVATFKAKTDGPYYVSDAKTKGLQLRVAPDGSRSWSVRYRVHGQQKRLTLGDATVIPPNDDPDNKLKGARTLALEELLRVKNGVDPQAEKRAAKRAAEAAKEAAEAAKRAADRNSIEQLCADFIERYAQKHKRTWRTDQSKINCEILPRWRGRPVSSITRRDCRDLLEEIADRGAPIMANRTGALLSRLFRYAVEDREIIPANPAARLPKLGVEYAARPEGEVETKAYSDEEVRTIWKATDALDPTPRAIYRLGLITGQRPTEISGMEWSEINGSWWTIAGRRTKNGREHRVFLTQIALDLLADVPRTEKQKRVFAGFRGARQLSATNAIVFAKVRKREKPRHAMRDTVATGLAKSGVAVEDIAKVLNHSYGPKVTAGYTAYSYDRERRLALQKWSRALTAILEPKKGTTKVVSIARG